jgi:hypothetical protein
MCYRNTLLDVGSSGFPMIKKTVTLVTDKPISIIEFHTVFGQNGSNGRLNTTCGLGKFGDLEVLFAQHIFVKVYDLL